jgi:hypothetical protein
MSPQTITAIGNADAATELIRRLMVFVRAASPVEFDIHFEEQAAELEKRLAYLADKPDDANLARLSASTQLSVIRGVLDF